MRAGETGLARNFSRTLFDEENLILRRTQRARLYFMRVLPVLLFILAASCFAQTAATYRQEATEFAQQKSWDQAIANYRKALELEPNDALTHYNLALALKYKGDAWQAVQEFQAAFASSRNGPMPTTD